ncbi:MAG: DUF1289 domain-containing protein [Betaproteobacteria bacterium HGW-Betaproteobacteria-10]|jgi:hypothetical protein|nr:MAG: DUF1289 domain-containing protein [Betaproteobacteria bacterium HGW-Betaproteobacteria-10]
MIPSPCINICQMAAPGGLCIGCLRSLDEITVWSKIDDAARTRILATISQRRRALAAAGAPLSTNKPG